MNFGLTEDQILLCKAVKDLCNKKLNEGVFNDEEQGVFPLHKWKVLGEFGIHGLPIPEEYGGMGQTMLTTALAIESLGYGCKDEGLIFSVCAHMLTCAIPIWRFGTGEQKKKYLPSLSSGKLIGGNGITEANAGSDTSSIETKVSKESEFFIINGTKLFVTNGPIADLLIIYAKYTNGMKMANISAFIVEKDHGYKIGQIFKKMGLRTSPTSEIILDNCKIPFSNLLGRDRLGILVFNESMLWERIIMSAYHIGAMKQQYESVLEYAVKRKQFSQQLVKFSNISDKLIEMRLRIETSKLFLYKVCWKYDNGKVDFTDASLLKLLTSEAKVKNSLDAVQIFGAYGYMKESEVEKQLRDSIASKIYSGTNEIQKRIIAEKF